jgi:hypothetical protein
MRPTQAEFCKARVSSAVVKFEKEDDWLKRVLEDECAAASEEFREAQPQC